MPDNPLDENRLCFLRVAVRRAEVSKASNHRDGPRLVNVHRMATCVLWRNSQIGWFFFFFEKKILDWMVPFSNHDSQFKHSFFVMAYFLAFCIEVTCSFDHASP